MVFANYPKKEHYIFGSNLEYHEEIEKYLAFFILMRKRWKSVGFWVFAVCGFCCGFFLLRLLVCFILVGWLVLFCLFMVGFVLFCCSLGFEVLVE